jgi:ribosomal protein S18 acetylase RimI-like enzyme
MIRAITTADADMVAALIRSAFADLGLEPPPSALRVTAEDVAAHLGAGGSGALYETAGCVLWAVRDDGLYLSRLAVQKEARGRGIGSALLAHLEAVARAAGLARMHLQVRLALAGNRRLFRRAGFVEGELHSHPGFDHPTFVSAEKILDYRANPGV